MSKKDTQMRTEKLEFHIQNEDYFGTLATIIDLLNQDLEKNLGKHEKMLSKIRDDLVYLQKNYRIVKK